MTPAWAGLRGRAVAAILLAASGLGAQVKIESARWGYGLGKSVVERRHNLLTVVLRNDTDKVYDGAVLLRPGRVFDSGAEHAVPCYVGPGESRRVQFAPLVASAYESWQVQPRGHRGETLDGMHGTRPETVLLRESGALIERKVGIPAFDESVFPASVTATDALGAVVLDRAPQLLAAQRQAFMDWLHCGGRVHLYRRGGTFPVFEQELAPLNDPANSFTVGRGAVIRHRVDLGEAGSLAHLAPAAADRDMARSRYARDDEWLVALRALVRPDHNWPLIFTVLALFFVLVVPVQGYLSFHKFGYIGSTVFLLAAVAGCTWVLYVIGARGYGEQSLVHSLSYARSLGGGRCDVVQYKNVFVTSGGTYGIGHDAKGSLYEAPGSPPFSSLSVAGNKAQLRTRIPVFSSQAMIHRGVFEAAAPPFEVVHWDPGGLHGLRLRCGAGVRAGWAICEGRATVLRTVGDEMRDGAVRPASEEFASRTGFGFSSPSYGYGADRRERSLEQVVMEIARPLLAEHLGLSDDQNAPLAGPDQLRLVLLCDSPAALRARGEALGTEKGMVLYDVILDRPGR